jgi:hypothetical protein
MKWDKKRHKLLKLLSDKRIRFECDEMENHEPLGISYTDLEAHLRCSRRVLFLFSDEQLKNEEISHSYENGIKGIAGSKNCLIALSNKKYKKRYINDILSSIKLWCQLLIPTLSLIVAILAISYKIEDNRDSINIEFQKYENKVNLLENRIDSLQSSINFPDSL